MKPAKPENSRRTFLRRALAASAAAGAATGSLDAVADVVTGEQEPSQNKGYHLTEHVKAYYKSLTR